MTEIGCQASLVLRCLLGTYMYLKEVIFSQNIDVGIAFCMNYANM